MESRVRVWFASRNAGKLREVRALLAELPIRLVGLEELPGLRLPEEGDDYTANASAKAAAAARACGELALGDDSGLEVAVLGGAPGPRSARYGGPGLEDGARCQALLEALREVPPERRAARFVCVAALATPDGELVTARGECSGRILMAPRGSGGFGYDPVFGIASNGPSIAELSREEKQRISHRAHAFRALAGELRTRLR
jgi:XTP/dITP diphosphohydrolase